MCSKFFKSQGLHVNGAWPTRANMKWPQDVYCIQFRSGLIESVASIENVTIDLSSHRIKSAIYFFEKLAQIKHHLQMIAFSPLDLVNFLDKDAYIIKHLYLQRTPIFAGATTRALHNMGIQFMPDVTFSEYFGKVENKHNSMSDDSRRPRKKDSDVRKRIAIWRGAPSGVATRLLNLQRIQLCLLSKSRPDLLDAKLSQANYGLLSSHDNRLIRDMHLTASYTSEKSLNSGIHINVDGFGTTSGFHKKLASSSVVLKVASPNVKSYDGLEDPMDVLEWWYPMLKPWIHYIPVQSDLTDLFMRIKWVHTHETEVKNIVHFGNNVLHNITYEALLQTTQKNLRY